MTNLIETAVEAAGVAIHEAGHLVCAELCGHKLQRATLDLDTLDGQAFFHSPAGTTAINDSAPLAAGAVAHARYFGRRDWKAFLSEHDRKELAESARQFRHTDVEAFIDRAGARARELLGTPAAWAKVQSLAVRLLESGGNITFKQ